MPSAQREVVSSFLERQLASAKESELTPDNTHPYVFLFLAAVQLPLLLWASPSSFPSRVHLRSL